MGEVTSCGVCGSGRLYTILDMGFQPLPERMGEGPRYPLMLMECESCSLVQLSWHPDERAVFPVDHPYATGNTRALREHHSLLATEITHAAPLMKGDLVVDIGANDGTLLRALSPHSPDDLRLAAVEPTNQARKCREAGFATYQEFFTEATARKIRGDLGPAKVITATNVLAHVPDPHEFMRGVQWLLADDGVFVTENHDVRSVTAGLQIDTVYHEHLRYYGIVPLARLLGMHGLDVTSAVPVASHGGSVRTMARFRARHLQQRAYEASRKLHEMVAAAAQDSKVYGVGAATRAVPLIHYASLAPYLACVCEVPQSEKIGKLMPGTQVPVVDEARLLEDQPGYALLFPWHLSASLIPKLRADGYEGRFIIPLPEPRIVNG